MHAITVAGEMRIFRRSLMPVRVPAARDFKLEIDEFRTSNLCEYALAVEGEEPLLVDAELVHVDVVEACVGVFADRLEVPLWVGAAGDALRDGALCQRLDRRLEVARV